MNRVLRKIRQEFINHLEAQISSRNRNGIRISQRPGTKLWKHQQEDTEMKAMDTP
jgi:hypothetical protein